MRPRCNTPAGWRERKRLQRAKSRLQAAGAVIDQDPGDEDDAQDGER